MPRLPTYTAQGTLSTPRINFPEATDLAPYQAGRELVQSANTLTGVAAKIGGDLKREADALDFATMRGLYDAGVHQIMSDLDTDPTIELSPEAYFATFNTRNEQLKRDVLRSTNNTGAHRIFESYTAQRGPEFAIEARDRGWKQSVVKQNARRRDLADIFSDLAARAKSPSEKDSYVNAYLELINGAERARQIDPDVAQKERIAFKNKAELDYAKIVARTNPDAFIEMDDEGAFSRVDPVSQSYLRDFAEKTVARRQSQAAAKWKNHERWMAEDIERRIVQRIGDRTLTREFLNDVREYITSEKGAAYDKVLRDWEAGIGTGNPQIEDAFYTLVYSTVATTRPEEILNSLVSAKGRGEVGNDKFPTWAGHLQSLMNMKQSNERAARSEARGLADKNEADLRRVQSASYHGVIGMLDDTFQTTGIFAIDQTAQEAKRRMKELLLTESNYINPAGADAREVYAKYLPSIIVGVDKRVGTHLTALQQRILPYKSVPEIIDALKRGKLKEDQARGMLEAANDIVRIQKEQVRLKSLMPSGGK